jgi:subtilase family serine protease
MVSSGNAAGDNHSLRCGRPERRERLQFETLETRNMLSADPLTVDVGENAENAAAAADMAHTQVTDLASGYTAPIGYTPAEIAAAYGFNQIKFGSVVGNGAGQTIAIVDAYNDPNIASDLQKFDKQFGLAAPKFTEVKQTLNGQGPMNSAGWSLEISLDVEWAHAMAPAANIELVEAYSPTLSNLLTCVQYAAAQPGVSVVSMSWGASEFSSEANYNSYFTTPAGPHRCLLRRLVRRQWCRSPLAGDFDQCAVGGGHQPESQQ